MSRHRLISDHSVDQEAASITATYSLDRVWRSSPIVSRAIGWVVWLTGIPSPGVLLKFDSLIPNVAKTDTHIVAVAQIIVAEMAMLYASRRPASITGEDVKILRLRAPASTTLCGGIRLAYLDTSEISFADE